MENLDVWTIISLILGVLATVFVAFWSKVKVKLSQILTAGKELLDVGSALNDALLDNKITPEEAAKIKKEWLEAKAAFKSLIGK